MKNTKTTHKIFSLLLAIALVCGMIQMSGIMAMADSNPYSSVKTGDVIKVGGHDWRVLEVIDGKALLLSDKVLEIKPYHTKNESITWEQSYIRQYLNGDFYNKTFNAEEKALIAETRNETKGNPWIRDAVSGGNDTTDRVFLLSVEDVFQYLVREQMPSTHTGGWIDDQKNPARAASASGETRFWWLRTLDQSGYGAVYIMLDGRIGVGGGNAEEANWGGIRPAMWLNINADVATNTQPPTSTPAPTTPAPSIGNGITVILDGNTLSFDVPPQLIGGRTMVPLRAIFEEMGASIEWDGATQTVTATKGNTEVILTIGSTSPTVNGQVVPLDQPGIIVDSRTLAPLRFVAEAFGGVVEWDGATQTATITSGSVPMPQNVIPISTSNQWDGEYICHGTDYKMIISNNGRIIKLVWGGGEIEYDISIQFQKHSITNDEIYGYSNDPNAGVNPEIRITWIDNDTIERTETVTRGNGEVSVQGGSGIYTRLR